MEGKEGRRRERMDADLNSEDGKEGCRAVSGGV